MILPEPPPSQGELHFRLFGIPVRVHPTFWIVMVLFGLGSTEGKPGPIAIWTLIGFVSILVHELGHALAARAFGYWPRITLYGLGGVAVYEPTRRHPWREIAITLAGPGAGLLLAAITFAAVRAKHGPPFTFDGPLGIIPFWINIANPNLALAVLFLLFMNIFWSLLNLLPVFPLDGGRLAREVLILALPSDGLRLSLWLSIGTAVGLGVLSLAKYHEYYLAAFFGYLAYSSYAMYEGYFGRGGRY